MLGRCFLPIMMATLVSGCLMTMKPAFNAGNSEIASESAAFMDYVEVWEARYGPRNSVRIVADEGRRIVDLGGHFVTEDGEFYNSVGMLGGRPAVCMAHHEGIEDIAARNGVTITVERPESSNADLSSEMTADGSEEALYAFIVDVFTNGQLVCLAPGPEGLE